MIASLALTIKKQFGVSYTFLGFGGIPLFTRGYCWDSLIGWYSRILAGIQIYLDYITSNSHITHQFSGLGVLW